MKIVYCINSICARGGIEMVTLTKANALATLGYDVYLVVTDNKKQPIVSLHPSVNLVDLDINYYADDWKSRWHVLYGILVKRILHKKRLANILHEIQPDVVISVGTAEKNMLPKIRGGWKCIREFHYSHTYRILKSESLLDKILARGGNMLDRFTLRKYDMIVALTEEDKTANWNLYNNVVVIPNPIRSSFDVISNLMSKRIVAAGRLTHQKNFVSLVRAFSVVAAKHPDWSLDIYGEGCQKQMLEQEIERLGLNGVVNLFGYTSNLSLAYSKASIFVLSSIYEGFPLVIVEAMSCGLPVVSYACPCGPRDIISDGKDGFLVPVNDEKQLADRICYLIEHEDVRQQMGAAAIEKSKQFSLDKIMARWTSLFDSLVSE
jgi:glycosyltransferase involved in cell wall biosynthesis